MDKNTANNMGKVMDALCDVTKLATNLTEAGKEKKMVHNSDDSNNNESNPNQNVQIHIGDTPKAGSEKKAYIIKEKPVIHKEFPDNRALTDEECKVALEKARMEQELKYREMDFQRQRMEIERQDRLHQEEYIRKQDEQKQAQLEKRRKIRNIVGTVLGCLGIGCIGYGMYTDYKTKTAAIAAGVTPPSPGGFSLSIDHGNVLPAEGKVE